MPRVATGKRALRQQLKSVQRELSAVQSDLKALEQGKPIRPRKVRGVESARRTHRSSGDYAVPNLDGGRSGAEDRVESLLEAQKKRPRQPVDEGRLAEEDRTVKERAKRVRDERFSDYLASSFEAGDSLRYERRIQRNKAVFVAIVTLIVLVWVLRKLLA